LNVRIRILIVAAVVAGLGTAIFFRVSGGTSPPSRGPVIARVDGDPIYLADARARVAGIETVHGGVESLGEDWPDRILDSLVDDVLIRRQAQASGISLTDDKIDEAVDSIRAGFPSENDFSAWLDRQGMTLDELERRIRLNLLGARVYLEVTREVSVSPEDVRAYYRRHREEYDTGDRVIPLLEVRVEIRERLRKKEKDRAFGVWLDEQRRNVDVVVVREDWWGSL